MPKTGAELRELTIAAMQRNNIVIGMISMATGNPGQFEIARNWQVEGGPKILVGGSSRTVMGEQTPEQVASLYDAGDMFYLGELGLQYLGHTLDEAKFEPYLAIAEAKGIPVAIHTGLGSPEMARGPAPDFRIDMGNPLRLEEVLIRHPKLKIWAMHAGFPWDAEMFAIMQQFTNVYVDLGVHTWLMPQDVFDARLKWLMDMGMGKRIMFGTDQMFWPQAIDEAVAKVENSAVLTREQKDDIFYNNAVRFFGFDDSPDSD